MSSENNHQLNIFSFSAVWLRVTGETDIKNQNDLASVVGVSQGAVSGRKSNDIWPEEWAYRIGRKYNLLTEWILTGEGPKNLDESAKRKELEFPILKEIEDWLKTLVVNDSKRIDWFAVSFQDAFPMFKAWTKRKEDQEMQDSSIPKEKIA